jgi:glycolate oxidase
LDRYNRVTEDVVRELKKICGPRGVLTGGSKSLHIYSHDQVAGKTYARAPEVVVKPSTNEEIVSIIKLANRHRIPVTPRGAGSGLSGGAVPIYGGICLSVERMNRILEIDRENLMAVVEPGVVTNKLDAALREYGLFFAGYPMSEEFCFIAGNVAENAGGGKAIKYGVTGKYITGLELVTPLGDLLQLGGKRFKDVTGYDLVSLMIGSEGTLGVFTKIFVRLLPRPLHRITLLALFEDMETAIALVPIIMTQGRLIPTSIEFMDQLCLHATCKQLKETIAYEPAGALLLFEVDGKDENQVRRDATTIQQLCEEHLAQKVYVAETEEESERFWRIRKQVPWVLKRINPAQSLEDIVVPIARIPSMMETLMQIGEKYDVLIPCFGHAGDGNLHATPLKNPEHSGEHWERILPEILGDIYRAAAEAGGTISGEHGIGHKRKGYMELVMSKTQIEMMRSIKRVLDPNNIMNPGKIFD